MHLTEITESLRAIAGRLRLIDEPEQCLEQEPWVVDANLAIDQAMREADQLAERVEQAAVIVG